MAATKKPTAPKKAPAPKKANRADKADAAVAYAPAPGERAIFDARWLYRVARAYRLNWRPLSARQQIVVERVSQIIERSEIVDTIMAAAGSVVSRLPEAPVLRLEVINAIPLRRVWTAVGIVIDDRVDREAALAKLGQHEISIQAGRVRPVHWCHVEDLLFAQGIGRRPTGWIACGHY